MPMNPNTPSLAVPVDDSDWMAGPVEAPITLVEYADFECSNVARLEAMVQAVRRLAGNGPALCVPPSPLDAQASARGPGGRNLGSSRSAGHVLGHARYPLTADEFNEVGAEIVRALDYYKVPEREKQELVAAYMTAMNDVVDESA